VVADIDRGGVFASLFGTLALLSPADQALVCGFVINRFRGDQRVLDPGLEMLHRLTGRPTWGVVPWRDGLAFDAEDSLALDAPVAPAGLPHGRHTLRVAVVRLPRTSNATDVDALAAEPGVLVRWTTSPSEVLDADLVVVPGTRATVHDLAWLRSTGLAAALAERAAAGGAVLGLCGGYQLLGRTITDDVESRAGTVAGLGLLPVAVRFEGGQDRRPPGRLRLRRAGDHGVRDPPRPGGRRPRGAALPRRVPGRRRARHELARDTRQRRLPPARTSRRSPSRPAVTSSPPPTPTWRPCAPAGSTSWRTSWPTPWTPTPWSAPSCTARPRACPFVPPGAPG
jgi:hypothetical protein